METPLQEEQDGEYRDEAGYGAEGGYGAESGYREEEELAGYNSEDEYSHVGVTLTEAEWVEKDLRFKYILIVYFNNPIKNNRVGRIIKDESMGEYFLLQIRGNL